MAIAASEFEGGDPKIAVLTGGFVPLLTLLERLSILGYSFDMAKWATFVDSGLLREVPATASNDCQVPLTVEARVRRILDVERRLRLDPSLGKLAFFLLVAGLEAVPVSLVIDHIDASIDKFFIAAQGMLRRSPHRPVALGPDGEHRLASELARAIARAYPPANASTAAAYEELLATAFVLFLRCNWRNRKPGPPRLWHRVLTGEFLDYDALPVKSIADCDSGSEVPARHALPAVDRAQLVAGIRRDGLADPHELAQAVRDACTIITTAAPEFPELGTGPSPITRQGAFAAWGLSLVPPLLAAGLFRVSLSTRGEKYVNLIPDRRETGLESILRTVRVHWHT